METINNYTGNILIADLASGECETEELSQELVEKALGGAAINMELYEQYKDRDPLILGTGFLRQPFSLLMPGSADRKEPGNGCYRPCTAYLAGRRRAKAFRV